MASETNATKPALLFVPDFSGFTRFVQATEISHSRHIIEELLEKLLEANDIELQVSEVEGDAILFYKFGAPPAAEDFFKQVQKMFVAFHGHLRLYETQRICQCGACTSAHGLTLKVVSHYGEITLSHIKNHVKLFGENVITAHRLLKNDISEHEYALFTQALAQKWPQGVTAAWAQRKDGSQEYDVGKVHYAYVSLAPLRESIPPPRVEDFSIPGAKVHVFSSEQRVRAPLDLVFEVASDLPKRLQWIAGAKDVELLNDQVNRVGTKHRCIVDKNNPIMVTTAATRTGDTITLTETDEKKSVCTVCTIRQEGEEQTHVRIDGFIKDNIVLKLLFTLLLRRKFGQRFQSSNEKLKFYCEELYNKQRTSRPASA
jgi:hypothetical protein